MKAVADDTRMDILNLLLEKAATVSQLAEALGKPKGRSGTAPRCSRMQV